MRAYYNEIDPGAAAWLRELIKAGHITGGVVDERSIVDVRAGDVAEFDRVHFFAGIGGWDYALRLAGWPDDRPVWTGSCPCQPFSSAGKQKGHSDARNLWPEMLRLIRECRPDTIFGEQVASAIGHGWIDGVCTDLEAEDYACGQIVLPACSVGPPHIRQRLWWVADAECANARLREPGIERQSRIGRIGSSDDCNAGGLANTSNAKAARLGRNGLQVLPDETTVIAGGPNAWSDFALIHCRDGKARRTQPGLFPLAHGIPARVVRLRGYGNAITPQAAETFIRAYLESEGR